jgi:hypothetical protein
VPIALSFTDAARGGGLKRAQTITGAKSSIRAMLLLLSGSEQDVHVTPREIQFAWRF